MFCESSQINSPEDLDSSNRLNVSASIPSHPKIQYFERVGAPVCSNMVIWIDDKETGDNGCAFILQTVT